MEDAWKDQPKEKMQEQIAMSRRGVMLFCYGVVASSRYCGEHANAHGHHQYLFALTLTRRFSCRCDVCHKSQVGGGQNLSRSRQNQPPLHRNAGNTLASHTIRQSFSSAKYIEILSQNCAQS